MRILFLSAWFPYPANNGSKIRVYNLLRGFSQHHDVTLLTLTDEPINTVPPELATICRDVQWVEKRAYHAASPRAVAGFLSPTPRSIVDTFVPAMRERIQRELATGQYDLVIASQWATAAYLADYRGVPAIFEEVEVGIFDTKRSAAASPLRRLRHELTWLKLRQYVRNLLPRFAACTVVSQAEAALLQRMVPNYSRISVIPNGVRLADYAPFISEPRPHALSFTGSFRYFANHDAMQWFLREIFPLILSRVPEARLTITGDHANLPLPPTKNVTLTGFVEDVRPLVGAAWASLAPIRLGGGTRLKILEAMALRSPVIATSKGAEGLDVRHGEHLLLADSPEAFADATVRLLTSPQLRHDLAERAYHLMEQKYDWSVILPDFLQLIETAAPKPVR